MPYKIQTYAEFLDTYKKYKYDQKCYIPECNKPGLYEGGDARCWCPMCEKHADMKDRYRVDLLYIKRKLEARLKWDKDNQEAKDKLNFVYRQLKYICTKIDEEAADGRDTE